MVLLSLPRRLFIHLHTAAADHVTWPRSRGARDAAFSLNTLSVALSQVHFQGLRVPLWMVYFIQWLEKGKMIYQILSGNWIRGYFFFAPPKIYLRENLQVCPRSSVIFQFRVKRVELLSLQFQSASRTHTFVHTALNNNRQNIIDLPIFPPKIAFPSSV